MSEPDELAGGEVRIEVVGQMADITLELATVPGVSAVFA